MTGIYYKDICGADLSRLDWGLLAALQDPLLLRLRREQLDTVLVSLVDAGLGPATAVRLLHNDLPADGTVENVALLARRTSGDVLRLMIL